MSIIRGPFTIKWGDDTIEDIEAISFQYEQNADEYQTVKGKVFELEKSVKVSAEITLLAADIASLAVILPQHFVANGGTLSTGEVVNNGIGAIDIVPHKCDESLLYNNLDITSCNNPKQTTRIINARSKISGIAISNKLQKIKVRFIGEPETSKAALQINSQDTFQGFLLDNGSPFALNDGNGLIV